MNIDLARLATLLPRVLQGVVSTSVLSLVILFILSIDRRFKRSTGDVPYACQVAAAIAVFLGVVLGIGGVGHSVAVVSLALRETEGYGPLVILRFTTGEMLLFSGAMNIALSRAIWTGRRWAIGVGVAAGLLFWLHLVFVFPLPGTGGTVPRVLGAWSAYLLWLGAAAFASRRETVVPTKLPSVQPAGA